VFPLFRSCSSYRRTERRGGDSYSADFCEALLEEAAFGLGVREPERALVFRVRLACAAEAAEQVGSRGVASVEDGSKLERRAQRAEGVLDRALPRSRRREWAGCCP
jgi:hypothetical protein